MKKFCYRCGALETEGEPLIQGLCQRCFTELNRLMEAPTEIDVTTCKRCNAYLLKRRWHEPLPNEPIENAIKETTLHELKIFKVTKSGKELLSPEMSGTDIAIEPNLKRGFVTVKVSGKIHEKQTQPKLEETQIKLNLTQKTCDTCSLKRAKHHEAILQVREKSPEKLWQIKTELEKLAANGEHFIADIQEQRGGLDFYLSSVSLAKKMAALLKTKFGAKLQESAKLIGQTKDGRRKYRVTISARLDDGDFKRKKP